MLDSLKIFLIYLPKIIGFPKDEFDILNLVLINSMFIINLKSHKMHFIIDLCKNKPFFICKIQ